MLMIPSRACCLCLLDLTPTRREPRHVDSELYCSTNRFIFIIHLAPKMIIKFRPYDSTCFRQYFPPPSFVRTGVY
jgi:hypothetical protein